MEDRVSKEWYKKPFGMLIAFLFLPVFVIWFAWTKSNWKKSSKIIISVIVILLTCCLSTSLMMSGQTELVENDSPTGVATPTPVEVKISPTSQPTDPVKEEIINYRIIQEKQERGDGGMTYYVLIDPLDKSDDSFKEDIKKLIKEITKIKGDKVTLRIFDSIEILNEFDKANDVMDPAITAEWIEQWNKRSSTHYIAAFVGDLTMVNGTKVDNSLTFFQNATTDNPEVGKYVETIEFYP